MSNIELETEIIDRLFLELSQFTKAKTLKELQLQKEVQKLSSALLWCWDNFSTTNEIRDKDRWHDIRRLVEVYRPL